MDIFLIQTVHKINISLLTSGQPYFWKQNETSKTNNKTNNLYLKAKSPIWFRASKLQEVYILDAIIFFLLFYSYICHVGLKKMTKELTYKQLNGNCNFQRKLKCWNSKIHSFPAQSRSGLSGGSCHGAGPQFGAPWLRASASSVPWKCLILPDGSFCFEDWCLGGQSRKPPAICFSLCTRQDHPEFCWEKYYTSSWAHTLAPGWTVSWQGPQARRAETISLDEPTRLYRTSHHARPISLFPSPVFSSMPR